MVGDITVNRFPHGMGAYACTYVLVWSPLLWLLLLIRDRGPAADGAA